MRIEAPQALMVGLYVRDAAGMRPRTGVAVPPLTPAVGIRAGLAPLAVPAASRQWAAWWEGELLRQEGPGSGWFTPDSVFGDGPELGALTRACLEEAMSWSADRGREHMAAVVGGGPGIEGAVVREVEAETGRRAGPFDLRITELPVAGATGRRVSGEHVLVSRALREDATAYRRWLAPVVRELV